MTIAKIVLFISALTFVLSYKIVAQEIDITPALQKIESGRIKDAETLLQALKTQNPNDPAVLFLDAVLTHDGNDAVNKYSIIIDKYPKSKYADAALYRIFSYYYSLGYYKKAEDYLNRLKKDYPDSPYIKSADRTLPGDDSPESSKTINTADKEKDTVGISEKQPVDSTRFSFTIQAGAFLNIENAKSLCSHLNKENYFTEIASKEIGGSILNVVSVGKFVKEEDAAPVLNYLETKFNLKGRIVKLSN